MIDAIVLKPMMYEGSDDVKLIVKPVAGQEKEGVSLWKEKVKIMTEAEYLQLIGEGKAIVPEKSDLIRCVKQIRESLVCLEGFLAPPQDTLETFKNYVVMTLDASEQVVKKAEGDSGVFDTSKEVLP